MRVALVTVKGADATSPATLLLPFTLIEYVLGAAPNGTTNEQSNVPVPVIEQVAGVLNTGAPLTVTWESEPAKPVPAMVNVVPTGPWFGVITTAGTVPVKTAVVESPAEKPVAVTVLEVPGLVVNVKPLPLVGWNVHEPPPVTVEMVQRVAAVGLVIVMVVSVEAKPLTVAVTVIPVGPWVGLSVRRTCVPTNVWDAVSEAALPVTVTWFVVPAPELNANPFPEFATNVHPLNDPLVNEQGLLVSAIEVLVSVSSKVIETSVVANPLPEAVIVTPLGPNVGLKVRLVTVPRNV